RPSRSSPVCTSTSLQSPTTDTAPLSLHDALPIFAGAGAAIAVTEPKYICIEQENSTLPGSSSVKANVAGSSGHMIVAVGMPNSRSEEHTSALQSREKLVCRLLHVQKKEILKNM